MFAPLWMDSSLFAAVIGKEIKPDEFVLDLGTGSGIQGITAAKQGARVVSVDINPEALKCAKENAVKHVVSDKIEFRQSDLFASVPEKFDVILFNPPFRWFKPRDILERGELDEDYKTLRSFFAEVTNHLSKNDQDLLVFSDSGDINYLNQLIEENKFKFKILEKQKSDTGWEYFVYEIR